MRFLALDTSSDYISLAIGDAQHIDLLEQQVGQRHAELTLPLLQQLLQQSNSTLADVAGIAFCAGPGSFTGLRIGCGIAQGLAFARNIPLLGVSALEALAWQQRNESEGLLCCIDARMQQVYTAGYRWHDGQLKEVAAARVCDPADVSLPDSQINWTGCGNGFAVYAEGLATTSARLAGIQAQARASARDLLELALPRFARGEGVTAAHAELIYLRDKVALKTSERVAR